MKTTILILAFILLAVSSVFGTDCGSVAFIRNFEGNNDVEHVGYYFQPNHCFSVVIPEGIVGRTSSQPSSQHGFGALISHENSGSYLQVEGDNGAWLDDPDDDTPRSLDKVVRFHLSLVQRESVRIVRKNVEETRLGSLQATRLTVFYNCADSDITFVKDGIFALDSAGSVYEIILFATDKGYGKGKIVLDKVANSWKLEKGKCGRE